MKRLWIAVLSLCFCFIPIAYAQVIALEIDATQKWTDTGVDILPNEILVIRAYGRYLESNDPQNPGAWIGPNGYPVPTTESSNASSYPMPEAAARCLIGNIDGAEPFEVGAVKVLAPSRSGRLSLGFNDINVANNKGYLVAFITKLAASSFARAVVVDVSKPWNDTGLDVNEGDLVIAMGFGVYNESNEFTDVTKWLGPSGYPKQNNSVGNYPLPNALSRGIIGKIGDSEPFVVGEYNQLEIKNNGRLFLGINDINFANNYGYCVMFLLHNPVSPLKTRARQTSGLLDGITLLNNYPNPFNPSTQINFELSGTEQVTVEIFNLQGHKIKTLVDETLVRGAHSITWDAHNDNGEPVSSGVYLCRISTNSFKESKTMTLIK